MKATPTNQMSSYELDSRGGEENKKEKKGNYSAEQYITSRANLFLSFVAVLCNKMCSTTSKIIITAEYNVQHIFV